MVKAYIPGPFKGREGESKGTVSLFVFDLMGMLIIDVASTLVR